jgi:hypothetical protein
MNKQASQHRTAQTLGAIFGTRAPEVLQDVSRNKPTITRKNKHGAAIQMLTFNEAKALLAAQGKVFETNAELEKALWDGMKLKDGGMLRDSYFSPKRIPSRYTD